MFARLSPASLASFSSRRPWTVVGAWLAVIALGLFLSATLLSDALTTDVELTNRPESVAAQDLIDERLGTEEGSSSEIVVFQSASSTVDSAAFRSTVETTLERINALGLEDVAPVADFYTDGDEGLVSEDRGTTIAFVTIESEESLKAVREVVHESSGSNGVDVMLTGLLSVNTEFNEIAEEDLQTGESIGILAAIIILALVFGALTAAVIPIILAMASIVVAIGITALIGQGFDLTFFVVNIITMMGLAVGIDYSLFVVSRYREERRKGLEKHDAIKMSGSTATRAVLFSGMTVVLALLGMVIMPDTIFKSLGIGAIVVVVVAVLSSMTLLPAVLGLLGDNINRFRVPYIGGKLNRPASVSSGQGAWDRITDAVMRRPGVSLAVACAILVAAAVPFFGISTGVSGVENTPEGTEARDAFVIVQEKFGFGQDSPAIIVIDGDPASPAVIEGVARLNAALIADPSFGEGEVETHPDGSLTLVRSRISGDPYSTASFNSIDRLRDEIIPAAFGANADKALVTGESAFMTDWLGNVATYTPIIFVFVLGLSFLLLALAFRSIVVPFTAIIMNLLSVGAAYGLVVLVFQEGVGASLLGFRQVDSIEAWLPLFLFSILFGLSMDYHVFLLSRIRERYDRTGDNTEAVRFGLRTTAGLITGAAVIMVAVFGGFALGRMPAMQQMGFGLAVAVFLDATVVRSLLVPSVMSLLGHRNWYLPAWLRWLPDMRVEGGELEPAHARVAAPSGASED
jgi:RND superfamily putative drug exporter